MPEEWLEGIRTSFPEDPAHRPTEAQLAVLRATINLIPLRHFACLNRLELRRPHQPPCKGGGNDPVRKIVRLSYKCLHKPYNQTYNITFLHELGHIVDHVFGVTDWINAQRTDDARAFIATPHEGATDFDGERTADCYMYYLATRLGDSSTNVPHYSGAEGQRRFALLLASPAFGSP